MEAVRRGDSNNAISKHFLNDHPNSRTSGERLFKVEILDRMESNLDRYIAEGIHIEDAILGGEANQLNSKGEWGRVSTKRITVVDNTRN